MKEDIYTGICKQCFYRAFCDRAIGYKVIDCHTYRQDTKEVI